MPFDLLELDGHGPSPLSGTARIHRGGNLRGILDAL